jgi:hypothetical protein
MRTGGSSQPEARLDPEGRTIDAVGRKAVALRRGVLTSMLAIAVLLFGACGNGIAQPPPSSTPTYSPSPSPSPMSSPSPTPSATTSPSSTPSTSPSVRSPEPIEVIRFQRVQASDGSFSVQLPRDWTVASAALGSFRAWGRQGEKVFELFASFPADQDSLQNAQALGVPAQAFGVIPLAVPPLDQVAIVRDLSPRLSPWIHDMQILESSALTPNQNPAAGIGAGLVHYRYTYTVSGASESERAGMPPALSSQDRVPMEGAALIFTLPPVYTGSFNYWTLFAIGGEAPQHLFSRDLPLLVGILQSLRYNPNAVSAQPPISNEWMSQVARGPFDHMWSNDDAYHESWLGVSAALGGNFRYRDPQDPTNVGTIPMDRFPAGSTLYFCNSEKLPAGYFSNPDPLGCYPGPYAAS